MFYSSTYFSKLSRLKFLTHPFFFSPKLLKHDFNTKYFLSSQDCVLILYIYSVDLYAVNSVIDVGKKNKQFCRFDKKIISAE